MIRLAVNTGFLVNRYPTPNEWAPIIRDLGVKHVQLTADLFSPYYPDAVLNKQSDQIERLSRDYGFSISSAFTGAFTRVNHFCHPDKEVREYWLNWFTRFAKYISIFGCSRLGSHIGIMSIDDDQCSRRQVQLRCIEYWIRLSDRLQKYGINELTWEHMSISREQGHTMEDIDRILEDFSAHESITLCLDPDHGDLSSSNARDYEPYGLIRKYFPYSSQIHLKQISHDKRKNFTFTDKNNKVGLIDAKKVLEIYKLTRSENSTREVEFILEVNARERQPDDSLIVNEVKESLDYWRAALDEANIAYE